MSELFDLRNIEYNLRPQTGFSLGAVYTANYGLRSLRYFAPKNLNMIPADIRVTLKIKSWIPDGCPCNLWRAYIRQLGYIN